MAVLLFSRRSRETSGQLLSKRISLLRPHPVVFVIQEPLRVVLVMGGSAFLFLLCLEESIARANFANTFIFNRL
ncbi:hypothetical protein [Pseudomonas oligotrophica]|uniref:hypothetical protein n=1 Tax=Pseudomonas oligotrophica TaxID=2912055 RepID=UPI001F27A791|nr:hypothetical protein [Pseudomonas oligotrophica]